MGWGRTLLLGDIGNRMDIEDTERDIDQLRRTLTGKQHADMSQDRRIEELAKENAEIKLYLAAVIRLLTAKGAIALDELRGMVEAIDGEDGRKDGQYSGSIA